jgi:hypothetical protein
VACLLSGLKTFDDAYPAHDRVLRVAKGLHGFHVYATEFWTEYLFSWASSNNTITADTSSRSLISLACELACELERTDSTIITDDPMTKPIDKRLEFLQQYPVLQKHVDRALRGRSLDSLKSRILQDHSRTAAECLFNIILTMCLDNQVKQQRSTTQPVSDRIGTLLASYQELVKFLLSQTYYPGISPDELESFKVHFGTAAFTCRLTSCSYATIGFDTAKLLMKHERTHIRWFQCTVPGCQYPPLVSNQALTNHRKKYHTPVITSKPILRHTSTSKRSNLNHSQGLRRESSANQPQEEQPGQQQLSPQQGQQPQQPQQSGQNNANPGMQPAGAPDPRILYGVPPQVPQDFPLHVLQVFPDDMAHFRNQRPNLAQIPDDQLRNIVLEMKKDSWAQQQQIRNQQLLLQQHILNQQAQAQTRAQIAPDQSQQGAQSQMGGPQGPSQQQSPQPNQTPRPQNVPVPNAMAQIAALQTNGQKQPSVTPEQTRPEPQPANNRAQPNQAMNEIVGRLRALGLETKQQSIQEVMPDIPMTPQEHSEMATKLQRIVVEMGKIGRTLINRYHITRDDARARIFFRTVSSKPNTMTYTNSTQRWRILKQFADDEKMSILKDAFSIRSSEIDHARDLLESMAKDLINARNADMAKQQGTPQAQSAQLTQPQQPMPQQQ